MVDDVTEINVNSIRNHAKRMFSALDYNKKYRRLDFYKPNSRQLLFHNSIATELALRAGNQLGKTTAAAAQLAKDATQIYPSWYQGRKFLARPPRSDLTTL
jgi:hypothetical protein